MEPGERGQRIGEEVRQPDRVRPRRRRVQATRAPEPEQREQGGGLVRGAQRVEQPVDHLVQRAGGDLQHGVGHGEVDHGVGVGPDRHVQGGEHQHRPAVTIQRQPGLQRRDPRRCPAQHRGLHQRVGAGRERQVRAEVGHRPGGRQGSRREGRADRDLGELDGRLGPAREAGRGGQSHPEPGSQHGIAGGRRGAEDEGEGHLAGAGGQRDGQRRGRAAVAALGGERIEPEQPGQVAEPGPDGRRVGGEVAQPGQDRPTAGRQRIGQRQRREGGVPADAEHREQVCERPVGRRVQRQGAQDGERGIQQLAGRLVAGHPHVPRLGSVEAQPPELDGEGGHRAVGGHREGERGAVQRDAAGGRAARQPDRGRDRDRPLRGAHDEARAGPAHPDQRHVHGGRQRGRGRRRGPRAEAQDRAVVALLRGHDQVQPTGRRRRQRHPLLRVRDVREVELLDRVAELPGGQPQQGLPLGPLGEHPAKVAARVVEPVLVEARRAVAGRHKAERGAEVDELLGQLQLDGHGRSSRSARGGPAAPR